MMLVLRLTVFQTPVGGSTVQEFKTFSDYVEARKREAEKAGCVNPKGKINVHCPCAVCSKRLADANFKETLRNRF